MHTMKNFIAISFLLLVACTPYQPLGLFGGYSETQLNDDMYKVSFRGNGYTSLDQVQNHLLHRCAQLTLEHGYKYFVILGGGTDDRVSAFSTPTTVNTTGYGNVMGSGYANTNYYGNGANTNYNYSGFGNYSSNTTIHPGQTHIVHRYGNTVIMKMLNSNKKIPTALNAEILMRNFNKSR